MAQRINLDPMFFKYQKHNMTSVLFQKHWNKLYVTQCSVTMPTWSHFLAKKNFKNKTNKQPTPQNVSLNRNSFHLALGSRFL
jgi:hypothetical protein